MLKAILRGRVWAPDIAQSAGLSVERVYTPLRRLQSAGHVKAERCPVRRRMKYRVVEPLGCLLADIWK